MRGRDRPRFTAHERSVGWEKLSSAIPLRDVSLGPRRLPRPRSRSEEERPLRGPARHHPSPIGLTSQNVYGYVQRHRVGLRVISPTHVRRNLDTRRSLAEDGGKSNVSLPNIAGILNQARICEPEHGRPTRYRPSHRGGRPPSSRPGLESRLIQFLTIVIVEISFVEESLVRTSVET